MAENPEKSALDKMQSAPSLIFEISEKFVLIAINMNFRSYNRPVLSTFRKNVYIGGTLFPGAGAFQNFRSSVSLSVAAHPPAQRHIVWSVYIAKCPQPPPPHGHGGARRWGKPVSGRRQDGDSIN